MNLVIEASRPKARKDAMIKILVRLSFVAQMLDICTKLLQI
jgi:hypothetical protein